MIPSRGTAAGGERIDPPHNGTRGPRYALPQRSGVGFETASTFDVANSTIREEHEWIWILSFTLGFAAGCGAVVAPAIQADIIDYDEYLTSERKEGAYLAVWNLVRKSAGSVTALVTGLVLQYTGFEPNIEQTEQTQTAIRALFALLPGICYVIGALLFLRFNFNEKEHAEVRQILAERLISNAEER